MSFCPVVRCPGCSLVLEVPNGVETFRCPCGIVLNTPRSVQEKKATPPPPIVSAVGVGGSVNQYSGGVLRPQSMVQDNVAQSGGTERTENAYEPDPPVWTPSQKFSDKTYDCEACDQPFGLLHRHHHCRCCGRLVHSSCSERQWPANMLPEAFNVRNEKLVRICRLCHSSMERFRNALLQADLLTAQTEYAQGKVLLCCPYSIYPNSLYPIHVAAGSGSIPVVQWLISLGCSMNVSDGRGFTPLGVAAENGQLELVRYLTRNGNGMVEEITDTWALQQCLKCALQQLDATGSFKAPDTSVSGAPPPYNAWKGTTNKTSAAPTPKDSHEEEEQFKIALAASRSMCTPTEDGTAASVTVCSVPADGLEVTQRVTQNTSSGECIICFDAPVETCFIPCGHSCCCRKCAEQFKEACPVCRGSVEQVIRTFSITS
mmetsp:Transcript_8292/g.13452  ORF Transcript_8292/g.13452 Transcript_8292/m.13452 type:complete len:430 (-) Transcript_8292:43-1332(-)